MATNEENTERRNKNLERKYKDIFAEFKRLSNITTSKGNMKYSYEWTLEQLEQKFYLEPITIERILREQTMNETQFKMDL